MSLTLPKACSMGGSQTGLVGTIGVTLLNPDGTVHTARTTAGIFEIGGGCYGVEIAFPDNWAGALKWDTGGGTPVYACEEYTTDGLADAILEDTDDLQTNQGNWATATSVALSAQGKLDVNTECDTALSDYGANTTVPDAAGVLPTAIEIRQEMDANSTKMAPSQNLGDYKASGFSTHNAADVKTAMEAVGSKLTEVKAKTDTIDWADITFLKNIEGGKWKVTANQMIFYQSDNTTEVARFNLFDASGDPAISGVMERVRV